VTCASAMFGLTSVSWAAIDGVSAPSAGKAATIMDSTALASSAELVSGSYSLQSEAISYPNGGVCGVEV